MRNIYLLLFLMLFRFLQAQIINIPDANFKAKLLSASSSNEIAQNLIGNYDVIDANGDGEIQVSEAQNIQKLYVPLSNISNLTGVEEFTNLQNLYCQYNQLTSLDVTQNVNLQTLYCNNNQLTSLDVSQNVNLEYFSCVNNQLTSLNVTQNVNLQTLYCNNNQLTSLDVSQNVNLEYFSCNTNQLTSLDVSQNLNLQELSCDINQLTSLGVSQNVNLEYLSCYSNQLTSLDVSNNLALTYLLCFDNQLSSLDVSNNLALIDLLCNDNQLSSIDASQNTLLFNLNVENNLNLNYIFAKNGVLRAFPPSPPPAPIGTGGLTFTGCDNLVYICVTDIYVQDVNDYIERHNTFFGSFPNPINVNSYCSFTPGGIFYDIFGNIKFDNNANGCDALDIDYSNLNLSIADGTNNGNIITNQTGDYYIPVQAGAYTITPNLENPSYFTISPTSYTVNFPVQASPFNQDFCVTSNGVHSDVEIMVIPINPARPGFDAAYKIIYRNKGTEVENGSVSLTFDDSVLEYVSSNPVYNSAGTNNVTWNYTNLQLFETREIEIVFNVNGPTETPAVNIDDVLNYTATILITNTDETPNDNTFTLSEIVRGSYDPNDKTCLQGETVEPSMIGEYVHYVIRFENTGTAAAQNIVVKDMIDLAKFDIFTLVPLKGSHDFFTRINGNKVEFIFENINLDFNDATNDGYVAFKIKTLPTLNIGDTFSNDANIYFDYNFPITTNTYTTTIAALSNQNFEFDSQFILYPNPSIAILNIQSKNSLEIQSIEIYNILGQVVVAIPNATNAIDVSSLKTGTYFVKVNTNNGSANTKFVKE